MTRVIGYAPGAYDLFHIGHLNLLRHAADNCDLLIAGVVSDEMLALTKGREPVVPLAERMEIVRSLRFVDAVHA
ncbi:MAG: tagD, partial [Frankiales bacterium]|nr:tagD [Frankiales bacterium]